MRISVTGRHVDVPGPMKEYAEDKAAKLQKYYDRIEQVEVIVGEDSGRHSVEMIVRTAHAETFVAQERGNDLFASVDLVVNRLERQLTKHKEKYRNRKHAIKRPPEITER